jgi:ComF family protein
VWHILLEKLFPETCPRCGFASRDGFCGECRREFLRIERACVRCGLPVPCAPCPASTAGWRLDAIRAPFVYAPPLTQCVQRLKYGRERHLGRALGRLAGSALESDARDIDALVAVPLHRRRLRERTFNQADEICAAIAKAIGRPMLTTGFHRTLDTRPQTGLGRTERLHGPAHAFRVERALGNLSVAIVDDVITTGATVNAFAHALRGAGAASIEAWSVARSVSR